MKSPKTRTLASSEEPILRGENQQPLPEFSTAAQIAKALQVTSRAVLAWEASGKIKAALRTGRTVRYNPEEVAKALGIHNTRSRGPDEPRLTATNTDESPTPKN